VILRDIDCTEQCEAMKRGEWPEPHPAVMAAHEKLAGQVFVLPNDERGEGHDGRSGECQFRPERDDPRSDGGDEG
jgi:hypothetical protein